MEERDRDEMSGDTPSDIGSKSEDWNSEAGRSSGSSEFESERGRSSDDTSSDLESDSDLGSNRGYGESGNINRDSLMTEH